jgi:hypothetical protein
MGANRHEGIEAVGGANDPHPLSFLEAGTDFPDLVVVRFPRLEERGGFVQNPGEQEAQCGQDNAPPKGRKAAPADKSHEPTARDSGLYL